MLRGYRRSPKGEAVFDDARRWEGWGTALKPAHEPIAMARKPFRGPVRDCVLKNGTGAMHIDACRVDWLCDEDKAAAAAAAATAQRVCRDAPGRERWAGNVGTFLDPHGSLATWQAKADLGRWPANVLTDGSLDVLEMFPPSARAAIRFFYAPKADKAEREFGLSDASRLTGEQIKGRKAGSAGTLTAHSGVKNGLRANVHPTVKPVDLMAWLCRLVTRPGGTVLDPFMGSGSTGIAAVRHGFAFIGIEQSPEYFDIARARIAAALAQEDAMPTIEREIARATRAIQLSMFEAAG